MNDFEIALERYQKAYLLMKKKELENYHLKVVHFIAIAVDLVKIPPSHSELCEQLDDLITE